MNLASWKYEAIKLPRCLPLAQTGRPKSEEGGGGLVGYRDREVKDGEREMGEADRENRAI